MSTSFILERLPVKLSGDNFYNKNLLERRRVYIFPTVNGWVYGMMLIVMLLGAINYNNSMAFVLCFLLASLGIIAMLHTYRNLTGIIVSSKKPEAVYAGQTAYLPIVLDNRFYISRYSVKLQKKTGTEKFFFKSYIEPCHSVSLDSNSQLNVAFPIQTKTRGIIKAGRLKISSEFPLGIFSAWSYFEPEDECLVYPCPKGQKEMPMVIRDDENASLGLESGVDDFSGFRKYRPGDPVNSIAWKIFAREKGLLVKQFSGKGNRVLLFTWESVSGLDNTESRLSQLCYWIILADKASMHYGLEIPGIKIEPAWGPKHKHHCLEKLARYGQENEPA